MRNGNDERPRGIGGTDAIRIVEGKWKELWLELASYLQPT